MRFLLLLLSPFFALASKLRSADPQDYMPLDEGTEWTYVSTHDQAAGGVFSMIHHKAIGAAEKHEGKEYHVVRQWSESTLKMPPTVSYCRKDQTGVYELEDLGYRLNERCLANFPIKLGTPWSTGSVFEDTETYEFVGIETIKINGVTYADCLHVRSKYGHGKIGCDSWEAPKVGMVKQVSLFGDGSKFVLLLKEFKPGNK
jgi:hypothetical protein